MSAPTVSWRTFLLLWLGQSVSLTGTMLTGIGLGIWVFLQTGSSTHFGIITLATLGPVALFGPFAGSFVDRFDRRHVLLFGHAMAGACSLVMLALLAFDLLEVWTIVIFVGLASASNSGEYPAFAASATLLVEPKQLPRASGMIELSVAIGQVIAPASAGALLAFSGPTAILLIDVATFSFAIIVLLVVRIPSAEAVESVSAETRHAPIRASLLEDVWMGWRYIRDRAGLWALLLFMCVNHLILGMAQVLLAPLVMGFADEKTLGMVLSLGGVGMVIGGLTIVVWGGPRRLLWGVLGFNALLGITLLLGALQPSAWLVAGVSFGALFCQALILGCFMPIWQRKVPPGLQGRVFSVKASFLALSAAIGFVLAGVLAEVVFEPLLASGGSLSQSVGAVLGVGPGRGVALMFVILGGVMLVSVLWAALHPRVRHLEAELPDQVGAGSQPD